MNRSTMALASITTTSTPTFAGRARRMEVSGSSTTVQLEDGRCVTLAAVPDPISARRIRRCVNRVASVRIDGSIERPVAHVRGIGHRLPVAFDIPLAAALALMEAGVPTVVGLATLGVIDHGRSR